MFANFVAGDMPAVCTYDTDRLFPSVADSWKSAPAAITEDASYAACVRSVPASKEAKMPSSRPERPVVEILNFSGFSFSLA